MSRAFIKEQEGDAVVDHLPERPQSPHPNYVTAAGLAKIEAERAALIERRKSLLKESETDIGTAEILRHVERDLRYLDARIERSILVDLSHQPQQEVAFGATVGVTDEDGGRHVFQIVGEDESDVSTGRVSWVSPLARALMRARISSVVTWERPAGDRILRVTSIRYSPGDGPAPRRPVLAGKPLPQPKFSAMPGAKPANKPKAGLAKAAATVRARPKLATKPKSKAAPKPTKPKLMSKPKAGARPAARKVAKPSATARKAKARGKRR